MRSKLFILISLLIGLFLAGSIQAQTEEELVARFLKKADKHHVKKVGFITFSGSYGKLSTVSDYNQFAIKTSPNIVNIGTEGRLVEGIYRSKEFNLAMGVMTSPKTSMEFGVAYWLKLGSNNVGNYNLSQVNYLDSVNHTGFELESKVQVFGITGNLNYFLFNNPDRDGTLHGSALKLGFGAGYYFARWNLWEGYSSYNLNSSVQQALTGKLSGSSIGLTASLGGEIPLKMGGIVIEGAVKYLYLNFAKMKWYNSNNEENVVTYNSDNDRVELDLSGGRVHFGLKRYFSW